MLATAGASLPLEIHILRDGAMAREHTRSTGCLGPTNVLSFPGHDRMPGILLLSVDTLYRECLLYGQSPVEHIVRLLAHGIAHTLGLDHSPRMDTLCTHMENTAHACLTQ